MLRFGDIDDAAADDVLVEPVIIGIRTCKAIDLASDAP